MAEFTLYIGNKNYSSWSLRGWLAAKLSGIAFDEVLIPLLRPESRQRILEISPAGRVPILRHGETTVWDSFAIGEYLAELVPHKRLWPEEAGARAEARAIAAEMHSGFAALRQQLPMNMRRDRPPPRIDAAAEADIARILGMWSRCYARYGGPYLFGALTLADAFYAPIVSRFTTYRVPLDGTGAAYCEAVWEWPALEAWRSAALAERWIIEEDEV